MIRRILPLLLCASIGCGPAASPEEASADALRRGRLSPEYDLRFWLLRAGDPAFTEAARYCEGRSLGDHPNCRPVRQALLLTSDTTREEARLRELEVRLRVMEDSLRRELERLTQTPRP